MKTVRELCDLVGVTRKTLRGYDEIGLLSPTIKSEEGNKIWLYDDRAVLELIGIQAFVEAGFERKKIKQLQDETGVSLASAIDEAIEALEEKKRRIEGTIRYFQTMKAAAQSQSADSSDTVREILSHFEKGSSAADFCNATIDAMASDDSWNADAMTATADFSAALTELCRLKELEPDAPQVQICAEKTCEKLKCMFGAEGEALSEAESAACGIALIRFLQSDTDAASRFAAVSLVNAGEFAEKALRVYGLSKSEKEQQFDELIQNFTE